MRALVLLAVVLCLASVSVSAIDIVRKQRSQRTHSALQGLTMAQRGWWDDNKCPLCKKIVGKLSDYLVDKLVNAPLDATSNAICIPADAIFDVACVAIAPVGTVLCPPLTIWFPSKCTDLVDAELNDVGKKAKRAARKLAAADFPSWAAANLCAKVGLC